MESGFAAQYRRWFAYEKDSHRKTLDSLQRIPESLRARDSFGKAVDLLAHIAAARTLWLHRFGVLPQGPADIFPRNVSLTEVEASLANIEPVWDGYLGNLDDAALLRQFEYRSLDGPRFRNTIADILTQLFGHSWYHRGQIAALVRSLGCEPAVTDFVFWCREPL